MINHIQTSLASAIDKKSKLIPDTFKVPSMSGERQRHLLNNIVSLPKSNYLEIGVHKGGTFISAMYGNTCHGTAIDNWCEFDQEGLSKKEFYENTKKFLQPSNYNVLEQDCFSVDLSILDTTNIYLYDGNHSEYAQAKALEYYYPILAETFIFMVDDWKWQQVQNGTRKAIEKMNFKNLFELELITDKDGDAENWWNGFFVCVLQK